MPLIQGCSKDAVSKNIKQLINEGYGMDQAAAIAYSIARKNKNKCSKERQKELKNI